MDVSLPPFALRTPPNARSEYRIFKFSDFAQTAGLISLTALVSALPSSALLFTARLGCRVTVPA